MKKFMYSTALAAGVLMTVGSTQAASVSSALFPGFQLLSDNSAESIVKGENNTDPNNATILEVGDRLRGILNIETAEKNGVTNQIGANGVNELSAIFDVQVASKSTFGVGGCAAAFCFTFAPYAGFAAEVESFGWADGTDAMVAFFEDSTVDFTRETTVAAGEASATNGSLFWLFGFDNDDDFWQASAITDDVAVAGAIPAPGNGGTFNLGLTLLDRDVGPDLNQVQCFNQFELSPTVVSACGSGSILGTVGTQTDFDVFDNVDFTVNVVSEPGTLGILGLGLLGLGAMTRRRRTNA